VTHQVRALALAAVSWLVALVLLSLVPASASAATVPYNDLAAKGSIALCNVDGTAVTGGSINDKPFVWMAASSVSAPAPWNGPGRVAYLSAFQPRKDAYPDKWNGDTLTASSRYSDPKHPLTVATPLDWSLAQYLHEFPVRWDGFVQLRMFFGAANQGINNGGTYPTADIKITGKTWTLVRGSTAGCKVGTATSSEVYEAHLPGATVKPTATRPPNASPKPTASSSTTASAQATAEPSLSAVAAGSSDRTDQGGGSSWFGPVAGLLIVVLGAIGYVAFRRARSGP
jgi:hypothetical protein